MNPSGLARGPRIVVRYYLRARANVRAFLQDLKAPIYLLTGCPIYIDSKHVCLIQQG